VPAFARELVVSVLVSGCGAAATAAQSSPPAPIVDAQLVEGHELELALTGVDGQTIQLADQRGGLVLLLLFATYDAPSLAAQRVVSTFAREHPDTVVLGVALEPNARTFARAFADVVSPEFWVTYDPSEDIVGGRTALGDVAVVPSVVMVDAYGRISGRFEGVPTARMLSELHASALLHGGIQARSEPARETQLPLLGTPAPRRIDAPRARQQVLDDGSLVIEPD
jgi:hypothetical protein